MARLNADARHAIERAAITPTQYAARFWDDATWGGDACGCPDDRCAGYHHEANESCGCLSALLAADFG